MSFLGDPPVAGFEPVVYLFSLLLVPLFVVIFWDFVKHLFDVIGRW